MKPTKLTANEIPPTTIQFENKFSNKRLKEITFKAYGFGPAVPLHHIPSIQLNNPENVTALLF